MAWVLTCRIAFAESRGRKAFELRRATEISLESAVDSLTDTAKICLPRKLYFALGLNNVVKTGDPLTIELGYNGTNKLEFTGYVARTAANDKVEILCEDEMWKLKQIKVHGVYPKTTLVALLKKILPGYTIDAGDWVLGDVKAQYTTVAAVLQEFKDKYNILSFFDGNKLVSGKHYSYREAKHAVELGSLQLPIGLEYYDASEVKIKIKAQSLMSNGKRLEVEVGDKDGTESKLLYSNIDSKEALRQHAKADMDRMKRTGFKGDFDWVGRPQMLSGEKIELTDIFYKERAGTYHIDGASKTWSASGFRQKIKLGIMV